VLEVGVGTGISLPYYPDHCRIIGVDISSEMLEKARRRVEELGLRHVERLAVMDAERLEFPDGSFDAVAAVCVVNTVPHPEAAMEEFARVLRPGGEIILLSRVGADGGVRRAVEKILQPVASRLGWRSEFPWERFSGWISSSQHDMAACERSPMPPFGHFSLLRFRKLPASAT
jgi:phosphatidylethanolamine/phosphatidyl-N-methylethanolamine N-methyltransferase